MSTTFRTYRIPLITTALVILVLAFWAWQDWRRLGEHIEERERHRAVGVSRMIAGAIHAMEENSRLGRGEMEAILEHIIRDSPYRFLVVEDEGKRILQAGDIPDGLTLPSEETERFAKGLYLFSREFHLFGDDGGKSTLEAHAAVNESGTLGSSRDKQLVILGGDGRNHEYPEMISHIVVPLTIAILLLSASIAAWIMVIRSRLLAEQLKAERTRSAHLEDLGLAAAGLAHETKNPLGIISGIAQQIARNPQVPKHCKSMLEAIIDEVDNSASRLGHFMTFARQRQIDPVRLNIHELTNGIAEILQPEFDAAKVALEVSCPPIEILADEEILRQVLVNLLLNSLQASSEHDTVQVGVELHGARATLVVQDQGCGISTDLLPEIFKPYVAGKADGHGLGLAIVKRFVEDHGWTIKADSQINRGTVIRVCGIRQFQKERA